MRKLVATVVATAGLIGLTAASASAPRDEQAAYLAKLVRAVPSSQIASARFGTPWARNVGGWTQDARWLYFTVRPYGAPHGEWQAHIVAGLVAQESHRRGWRRVLGLDVETLRADGSKHGLAGYAFCGFGGRLPCVAPVQRTPRARLIELAHKGATDAGLNLSHVRIWSFSGHLGVEMTVVVDDGGAYLDDRGSLLSELLSPIEQAGKDGRDLTEGTYVVVHDKTGRWVEVDAHAARTGVGIGGQNPFFNPCPETLVQPPNCR